MKHLKSSINDLRTVFDQGISIRYIAEPIVSFDQDQPISALIPFLEWADFDLVGVRRDGLVTGYAVRADLTEGTLGTFIHQFAPSLCVDQSTPLLSALKMLQQNLGIFVTAFDAVAGIVTKGDLQKAPVRMWLFGLVTLAEMHMLRIVRQCYPGNSWKERLGDSRIGAAMNILSERQKESTHIDLVDCIQFCDKRDLILAQPGMSASLGFASKKEAKAFLKQLEALRNDLAHGQDVVTSRWPHLVNLAERTEDFLKRCENLT
jgi:hypothetical protein